MIVDGKIIEILRIFGESLLELPILNCLHSAKPTAFSEKSKQAHARLYLPTLLTKPSKALIYEV